MSDFDTNAPLNRIKGESQKANDALRDYWLMGSGRSLQKLADQYIKDASSDTQVKKPPTVKISTINTWSLRNQWQARIVRQKEIDDAIALEEYRQRHMSPAEVVARLSDMGRADMADFADVRQPSDLIAKLNSHVVKKIIVNARRNKDGTITARTVIELYDAKGALDTLAKVLGLTINKTEITGKEGGPIETKTITPDFSKLTDEELEAYVSIARKFSDND